MQISRNTKIIASAPGLFARLFQDDHLLASLPLVVGENSPHYFLSLSVPRGEWQFDEGVEVFSMTKIFPLVIGDDSADTAANPDYRPNLANREARALEARLTMKFAALAADHARQLADTRASAEPVEPDPVEPVEPVDPEPEHAPEG